MHIDIVVIGINSEKTLSNCFKSILNVNYENQNLHIFYVDGGSSDASIAIARQYSRVTVIELNASHPTPGLGRNAGWKAGLAPLVLFLDSDTQLDPDYLTKAIPEIRMPEIGAVKGHRKEMYPEKTIYNWLGDQEWNDPPGEAKIFGGDVLIRRAILEQTGGYNEDVIAGEDPELSLRIRKLGWKIMQMDVLMCKHDLAMETFRQYFWRAYRTGYGYAAIHHLLGGHTPLWRKDLQRIVVRGGGFFFLMLCGLFSYGVTCLLGLGLLFYPRLFRVKAISKGKQLSINEAKIYAWHCSFVVIPQFFGVLRFYYGRIFGDPLRNKRSSP
jgi:glycosyltransferase involved in cell wall biosynthesis